MKVEDRIQAAIDFTNDVIANPDAFAEEMVVIPFDPELLSSAYGSGDSPISGKPTASPNSRRKPDETSVGCARTGSSSNG